MKRPDAGDMALLPQTEQEYWNINLDNRNSCYVEELKQVYSLLEELIIYTYGYEWLLEVAMKNSNDTQIFGNLWTHYDGTGANLKRVAEANKILENIHYKNENTAVTFEVYVTRIKEAYKILKDNGKVLNESQKVNKLARGIRCDAPAYLHTTVGIVQMYRALNNYFNLAVDRLSQFLSIRSHNVDFS